MVPAHPADPPASGGHRNLGRAPDAANPQWLWTEPDLAAWEKRFAALTEDELCAAFTRARSAILDQLKALDAAGWERIGTHAVFGQLDVAGLCRRTLEHDAEHLTEMLRRGG